MSNDETNLRIFLKGAGEIPPCPTDKFVNSFLAEMDGLNAPKPVPNFFGNYARIAAAFTLVSIGIGAWYINRQVPQYNDFQSIAIASITEPDALESENLSDALIYGEKSEDAFAASLVGSDDISTLVSISDP